MPTGPKRSTPKKRKLVATKKTMKPGRKSKPPISAKAASAAVKRYAAKQRVQVELSEEQMQALRRQLGIGTPGPLDPTQPFNITFVVKGQPKAFTDMNVASCAYWGDTCCA
jgi:hypothetical protein